MEHAEVLDSLMGARVLQWLSMLTCMDNHHANVHVAAFTIAQIGIIHCGSDSSWQPQVIVLTLIILHLCSRSHPVFGVTIGFLHAKKRDLQARIQDQTLSILCQQGLVDKGKSWPRMEDVIRETKSC